MPIFHSKLVTEFITSSCFVYAVMGSEPTGRFRTLYTAVKFTAGTNLAGWFNGGARKKQLHNTSFY